MQLASASATCHRRSLILHLPPGPAALPGSARPRIIDAVGDAVDYTVDTSGPAMDSATGSNFLVILRTGFDAPYGDGAESVIEPANGCMHSCVSESFDPDSTYSVQLDTIPARLLIDVVILAHDSRAMGFHIERVNLCAIPQNRVVTIDSDGNERAASWHSVVVDTDLLNATAT